MKIGFAEADLNKSGAIAAGFYEGKQLSPSAAALDAATGGALTRALAASKSTGKTGSVVDLLAPADIEAERILLVGLGKAEDLTAAKAANFGGAAYAALATGAAETAQILVDAPPGGPDSANFAAHVAYGAALRAYRFERYQTKKKKEDRPALAKLTIGTAKANAAKKLYADLDAVVQGVAFARDLVSEPPNTIYPASFAEELKALTKLGVEVEIFGEKDLKKLGMGALLGVGLGSHRETHMVVMRWSGAKGGAAPIALIGKGVTFDSGGLSLKPPKSMEDMKWDMAGAGAVAGAMRAIAGRKAKANVVGLVGLVENMPSGGAQRPGDIVKSMSGQTIEVLNTDAEGRLVLADVLWYAQDRFKPVAMVNLATLTGAIITALGVENVGLFSNDDAFTDKLNKAGQAVGETMWRLPLSDAYDKLIDSDIADMKNIGDGTAGSIIGAQFLQRFVNDVPWAHLDIAGVAWTKKDSPTVPKGASGWGVRLLDQLVRDNYEG
jgi:leucyl aminopeptidase